MFNLAHYRFRFQLRALQAMCLQGYQGSSFRGLLGHMLKKIVCPFKSSQCGACLLRYQCHYLKLFETPRLTAQAPNGTNHLPHPFILLPRLDRAVRLAKEEEFYIELVLLKVALPILPYIILAFEKMGQVGLGRHRYRFSIQQVEAMAGNLWQGVFQGQLSLPDNLGPSIGTYPQIVSQVELSTYTPLRIKQGGGYLQHLPFEVLIRRLLRRLDDLSRLYGEGELTVKIQSLLSQAENITTLRSNLHWTEVRRFSNRQQRHLNLGGLEGCISYVGELTPFAPWLVWGEALHVGQATSFGFGKYTLKFFGEAEN